VYIHAKCVDISTTIADTQQLLLMTNRKLHMRFQLQIDDLGWSWTVQVRIFREFRGISQILEATTANRM